MTCKFCDGHFIVWNNSEYQ